MQKALVATEGPGFESHLLLLFLNQACAGRARLVIGMRVCVCVYVCPRPRLLITNGVVWHDMDPIRLVKQVL